MINEQTNESETNQESESTARIETTQTSQAQAISINPSIAEIERFIQFLNKRFCLGIKNDIVVLIQKTEPQIKGYYSPNSWVFKHESESDNQATSNLNEITLSSINLLFEPYETIAHELAHYLNTLHGYKGNCRNYHTIEFKTQAERLGLAVQKGRYGFNQTSETEQFKQMVSQDFKPNPTAFKIFQPTDSRIVGIDGNGNPVDKDGNIIKREPKGKSRLILFSCGCGCKIRTARNEDKPLKAVCGYCNTPFKEVIKTPTEPTTAEPVSPTPTDTAETKPTKADLIKERERIKALLLKAEQEQDTSRARNIERAIGDLNFLINTYDNHKGRTF